jgi:hypothetical protein
LARAALLWAVLFAAFAATLGLPATEDSRFSPREARMLLAVESLVSDRDIDVADGYRERRYEQWTDERLEPVAGLTGGSLHEPPGLGFPLLLAPAYAVGGELACQLLVAALLALGFVAGAALARRLVPDPWATAAVIGAALSPPVLGAATSLTPEAVAAAAITGAALFTLRVRDDPRFWRAAVAAVLIGLLPWLSVKFLPVAVVCAAALARWLRRRSRGLVAFGALEIVLVPAIALLSVNHRLYGGFTAYAAVPGSPTGADAPVEYLARVPRMVTALIDPGHGLLVWAPMGILALLAIGLLARTLRERLRVALPAVVDVQVTAGFLAALCATQVLVATFLVPSLQDGWFPGRDLLPAVPAGAALCAWGLRHSPRAGGALVALTVLGGLWLLMAARFAGGRLAPPNGPLPWAGAELVVAAATTVMLTFLLTREMLRDRGLRL